MKSLVPGAANPRLVRRLVLLPGLLVFALGWSSGCGGQMVDSNGLLPGTQASGGSGLPSGIPSAATGGSAAMAAGAGGTPGAGSTVGGGTASGSGGAASGSPAGATGGAGSASVAAGTGGRAPGGSGNAGAAGPGSSGPAAAGMGLPCDVQTLLVNRCQTCHGPTPIGGAPSTLVTYQNLTGPSRLDPTKSEAEVAVARMQNTTLPMPPKPGTPATAAEVATLQAWIAAGYPAGSCGTGSSTGGGADGGVGPAGGGGPDAGTPAANDVFAAAPTCTSKNTSGGGEGPNMDPGMACISCHSRSGEAPKFSIAGTVYPTAHEPDQCHGADGSTGVQVVITGADGKAVTLTPNGVGNFSSSGAVKTPYQAKLVFMGRERLMVAAQTSGDCNSCHTQSGANAAPGRLVLP